MCSCCTAVRHVYMMLCSWHCVQKHTQWTCTQGVTPPSTASSAFGLPLPSRHPPARVAGRHPPACQRPQQHGGWPRAISIQLVKAVGQQVDQPGGRRYIAQAGAGPAQHGQLQGVEAADVALRLISSSTSTSKQQQKHRSSVDSAPSREACNGQQRCCPSCPRSIGATEPAQECPLQCTSSRTRPHHPLAAAGSWLRLCVHGR